LKNSKRRPSDAVSPTQASVGIIAMHMRNAPFDAWRAIWVLSTCLLAVAPLTAAAANVKFLGSASYSYSGNIAFLNADAYANYSGNGQSGPLRLELWAFATPYTGGTLGAGHKLASYQLEAVGAGWQTNNVNSGPIVYSPPPDGTWVFAMLITELSGFSAFNDGYAADDWRNLPPPVVVGTASAPALTPQVGLWWNPDEPGSGYALDYRHGVLVVTVYSYTTTGAAQWYLASGPLSGTLFSATLDKYIGGQCIACSNTVMPTPSGNDGIITIGFTSPTSATVTLPGGRVTRIQPQLF